MKASRCKNERHESRGKVGSREVGGKLVPAESSGLYIYYPIILFLVSGAVIIN